ncbi:uncharacterized protein LOC126628325 [Malus sylvestris]|uniref:uncharacterized protein LOC126628325 n=1 Tax=Malus sylvestris TaxID=3752 RepID=UPI0021ACA227|nr:uncharacterized protein LOC126628325 [Malus sylvestris]
MPASGSQWHQGGQPRQGEVDVSGAGSSRQFNQSGQGLASQGQGNQGNRGRGGRQQAQGRVNHISLQDAQNHPDLIMGDTYPEDKRIQGRHGGYDPSTYQF